MHHLEELGVETPPAMLGNYDEKILKALNLHTEEKIVPCVIIYPELESSSIENETIFESSVPILELVQGHKISGFRNFYRLCIKLPRK